MAQYQHLPHARYVRRSTLHNAHSKITCVGHRANPHQVQATANSYFGLMRHANAWRERQRFATTLRSCGHRVRADLTRIVV